MSVISRMELEFGNVGFWGEGKTGLRGPEKNLSEQSREPTTNSTHIWRRVRESNLGHIGGRRELSPLCQPCSPKKKEEIKLNTAFIGNIFILFKSTEILITKMYMKNIKG